jgi:hypothetical protein
MTYQDPNMPRRPHVRDERNYTGWVLGALAALAIAAVVIFNLNRNDSSQTASDSTNRPTMTQPASTANSPSTRGRELHRLRPTDNYRTDAPPQTVAVLFLNQ